MKSLVLFTFVLLCACASPKKHYTGSYHSLAPKHKKIAVLPIIFLNKNLNEKLSEDEKRELMLLENDVVQTAIYQQVIRETGKEKGNAKVVIENMATTNHKLEASGIDVLQIDKYPDDQLKTALQVDAILQVKISTPIMLHSTTGDVVKSILNNPFLVGFDPIVGQIRNLEVETIVTHAEIIDLNEGTAIWGFSKRRELRLTDKNTSLLQCIAKDVAKRFPYR